MIPPPTTTTLSAFRQARAAAGVGVGSAGTRAGRLARSTEGSPLGMLVFAPIAVRCARSPTSTRPRRSSIYVQEAGHSARLLFSPW